MLRIVFFCSGDFPVPTLKYFAESDNYDVVGIVGNRYKNVFTDTHITDISNDHNIMMVNSYDQMGEDKLCQWLKSLNPDMFVVISYKKLPKAILEIPKITSFNVHASILPFLGGSAPINWAIINGFTKTGLTSFVLNGMIDSGKIISNRECDIDTRDNFKSLFLRLSDMCVDFTVESINKILRAKINGLDLESSLLYNPYGVFMADKGTFFRDGLNKPFIAPKLTESNTRINWMDSPRNIHNFVRGLSPKPGAHTTINVRHHPSEKEETFKVKILETEILDAYMAAIEGYSDRDTSNADTDNKTFLYFLDGFPITNEILSIKEIQLENRKPMDIKSFLNGFRGFDQLGADDKLTINFI